MSTAAIDLDLLVEASAIEGQLQEGVSPRIIAARSSIGQRGVIVLGQQSDAAGNENVRHKPLKWTKKEEDFLKASQGILSEAAIAETLGRTGLAIRNHWYRELKLPAPSKSPAYVTGEQISTGLGLDTHSVTKLLTRGHIEFMALPFEKRTIRAVHKTTVLRWITNPLNWAYFKADRVGLKPPKRNVHSYDVDFWSYARKLVLKRKARWNDEWLEIGKAAKQLGIGRRLLNRAIHEGRIPFSTRFGNWKVLRSVISDPGIKIYSWLGRGGTIEAKQTMSLRMKEFLVLAEAIGISKRIMGILTGRDEETMRQYLLKLHGQGEISRIIQDRNLDVQYDAATDEAFADWRRHKRRFPFMSRMMMGLQENKSRNNQDTKTYNRIIDRTAAYLKMKRRSELKSLSANKEHLHGTRVSYMKGCKCVDCKAANTRYECERAKMRKAGMDNGLVPAERARGHLLMLSGKGVGRRTVSDKAGVSESVISLIRKGLKKQIRKETEKRILSISAKDAEGSTLVDAAHTWRLINELLKSGYTKKSLAQAMGLKLSLQLRKDKITVRSSRKAREMYAQLTAKQKAA